MASIREVHTDGWCVRLDLNHQVLRLEIPEVFVSWQPGTRKSSGPPLSPTLPLTTDGPVSAATLLLKAKQFDDGLHAAVELASQQGAGRFTGKAPLLRSLAATLAADLPRTNLTASAIIHAACELGVVAAACPDSLRGAVRTVVQEFLRDERISKPLGFYTWTDELGAIFRQDRLLQQPLDVAPADSLARALEQSSEASEAYDACLRLAARFTNPPDRPGVRDEGERRAFFPASRSHEVQLLEMLYSDRPIPDGFDLMGELIRRVRSGEINVNPLERSGWYDHQIWSLEPLVVPDRMAERARLELGKRYRQHLEDLFRGALALVRETHGKQVRGGVGGYAGPTQRPIWIYPNFTVEPLPSLYARRADAYRFVRSVLEETFGTEALHKMHRLTPEGLSTTGLAEELAWIEKLFAGAAATASRELGIHSPDESDAAARCFSEWRAALGSDRDVSSDVRMMVPVFFDLQRKKTKVWVFLGWGTTTVEAEYRVSPTVLAVEPSPPTRKPSAGSPPVLFMADRYELAGPIMAEVYVERLLDRDAFRRHCDRFRTRSAILDNLW